MKRYEKQDLAAQDAYWTSGWVWSCSCGRSDNGSQNHAAAVKSGQYHLGHVRGGQHHVRVDKLRKVCSREEYNSRIAYV